MIDRPLVILGATGSIGRQTLEVADTLDREVAVLAARRPSPELAGLAAHHPEALVVVTGATDDERDGFSRAIPNRVSWGTEAMLEAAATPGRIVVNGLVGAAGLRPTIAALSVGNRLALANKESLVAAGPLVTDALAGGGGELIPVDSEHSALFQLVAGTSTDEIASLVLTASGGPFRGWSVDRLESVTPAQALAHPTWSMGRRISVDSATLVNKGLEVIEAHVLFGVPFERIEVVVHPTSTVHSLIRFNDGTLLAHLGATDMRIPIAFAITHPDRAWPAADFDLVGLDLRFEDVDRSTFPALDLAYEVGRRGGTSPCVFNAADEIAVHAFLDGRIGFTGIVDLVSRVVEEMGSEPLDSVDHVLEVDRAARELAAAWVAGAC